MDLSNVDLGNLVFTIFFAILLLYSLYSMVYGIYKTIFWERAEGKIIKWEVLSKVRRGPYTLSITYINNKGQEKTGKIKLDKAFSDKFFDQYLNKETIEIGYKDKTGEIVLIESKEYFLGFPVLIVFLLFVVVTIYLHIFK